MFVVVSEGANGERVLTARATRSGAEGVARKRSASVTERGRRVFVMERDAYWRRRTGKRWAELVDHDLLNSVAPIERS